MPQDTKSRCLRQSYLGAPQGITHVEKVSLHVATEKQGSHNHMKIFKDYFQGPFSSVIRDLYRRFLGLQNTCKQLTRVAP